MAPDITLIDVPYDSGRRDWRHGAGPGALVAAGATERLAAGGASVTRATVDLPGDLLEAGGGVAAMRAVAGLVAARPQERPVVLAGNCGVTLGVLAGLRAAAPARRVGLLWFDAHGDLQTPATSASGFFDGMPLAMLTGRCWDALAASVPGHAPLPDAWAALVGGHDLDDAERRLLASSDLGWLSVEDIRSGAAAEEALLDALAARVDAVHVHVDLDVHDTSVAPANSYAVPGGLRTPEVHRVVTAAARRLPVASATVASWDPARDVAGRMREVGLDLLTLLGGLLAR